MIKKKTTLIPNPHVRTGILDDPTITGELDEISRGGAKAGRQYLASRIITVYQQVLERKEPANAVLYSLFLCDNIF